MNYFGDSLGEPLYSSKLHSLRDKHSRASIEIPSSHNSSSNKTQIDELLRCIICFSKVKNPQMCPSCSNLCCNTCIKKWLTEQKPQCPHCRCPLRISQLVNCRFVSEIATAIEQMHTKREEDNEVCSQHHAKLSYYCKTCETPICADCAMFGAEHKGHQFEHITKVYESHVELVKSEAQGLKTRLKDLTSHLTTVVSTIEQVTKAKEEKAVELGTVLEQMNQKLESELKSKLLVLLSQKGSITDEIEFLESLQGELNRQLLHSPKSVLIVKSVELVKMLRDINSKPITNYNKHTITAEFKSEIAPQYDSAIFYLRPFSFLRQNTEVVYSEPLHSNGLTWRLKVYPNGNGQAKNEHLSVFLEMVKGLQDLAKYEYKVEMINQRNPEVVTIREFASEFETGECWGYNKFFKIDQLEKDGYLVPEQDTIVLKYYVRAPTYYQHCQDQKRYIQHLERLRTQSNAMISELKDKLNREAERARKLSENPSTLSAIKNSVSPHAIESKNEEMKLMKMSSSSEKQEESDLYQKEEDEEEEVNFRDAQSEEGDLREEEEVKMNEEGDEEQEDQISYRGEEYLGQNFGLGQEDENEDEKKSSPSRIDDEKDGQQSASPVVEEYKLQDLYERNDDGDLLDVNYDKLDAFLDRDADNMLDTDKEDVEKESPPNEERLPEKNLANDDIQLKTLQQDYNNESSESLDEFCDKIHENMKKEEVLRPITVDNIFNSNSNEDLSSKAVSKNLLSAFNAELAAENKLKPEERRERDRSSLLLPDSLLKKLGNLRNLQNKEKSVDRSQDRSMDKRSYMPSMPKTERVNETEKENRA